MLQCKDTVTPQDLPSIATIEEMLAHDKVESQINDKNRVRPGKEHFVLGTPAF